MTSLFDFREGDTEPKGMTLLDNGVGANITGYTSVSIFLKSSDGLVESEASTANGGITVTTAALGVIALHPALLTVALVFSKQYYFGYVTVVDGNGKRSTFPQGKPFMFRMFQRFPGDG